MRANRAPQPCVGSQDGGGSTSKNRPNEDQLLRKVVAYASKQRSGIRRRKALPETHNNRAKTRHLLPKSGLESRVLTDLSLALTLAIFAACANNRRDALVLEFDSCKRREGAECDRAW